MSGKTKTKTFKIYEHEFRVNYTFIPAHISNYGPPNVPDEAEIHTINGYPPSFWSLQTGWVLQHEVIKYEKSTTNSNS